MILISHRGNISGPILEKENTVSYISQALEDGYYVEIDVWYVDNKWFLGHDEPKTETTYDFLNNSMFFLHAKNKNALEQLHLLDCLAEYFWHENDLYTLTSKNNIWVYTGKPLLQNCICVLPEKKYTDLHKICNGICSDYIKEYKNEQCS